MQISSLNLFSQVENKNLSVGVLVITAILIGLPLFSLVLWLKADYKHHKRPLKEADPNVNYTFWHHIKVVTFPLLSYRITFMIQKNSTNKPEHLENSTLKANSINQEDISDYQKEATTVTADATLPQAITHSEKVDTVVQSPPKDEINNPRNDFSA